MRRTLALAAVVLCASVVPAFAQSDKAGGLPYAGTWKLNMAKSDFGETTIEFTKIASGQMQFTMMGMSYQFQVDGKEYPSLMGRTATIASDRRVDERDEGIERRCCGPGVRKTWDSRCDLVAMMVHGLFVRPFGNTPLSSTSDPRRR